MVFILKVLEAIEKFEHSPTPKQEFAEYAVHPIQQYLVTLRAIREGNLAEVESCLTAFSFTRNQLSEMLIHAAAKDDYRISAAIIERGANITFSNHQAWHIAIEYGNRSVIKYLNKIANKGSPNKHTLYVVA